MFRTAVRLVRPSRCHSQKRKRDTPNVPFIVKTFQDVLLLTVFLLNKKKNPSELLLSNHRTDEKTRRSIYPPVSSLAHKRVHLNGLGVQPAKTGSSSSSLCLLARGEHFDGRVPVRANRYETRAEIEIRRRTTRVECETSYMNIPHFPAVRQRASYDVVFQTVEYRVTV